MKINSLKDYINGDYDEYSHCESCDKKVLKDDLKKLGIHDKGSHELLLLCESCLEDYENGIEIERYKDEE